MAMAAPAKRTDEGWLVNGPEKARTTLALAHGAGAGMDTEFMDFFAENLAGHDVRVVRFEFPYMMDRRRTGKRRPPDREPCLRTSWLDICKALAKKRLVIGGKSMGGRIATMIAEEANVAGLICLGYPFHPSGKPERVRTEHLRELTVPTLIIQGERDALGNKQEVQGYQLPVRISIHWLTDGDHSLKPRKKSGRTTEENWAEAVDVIREFLGSLA
jgi:hypothetical protein